MLFDGCFKGIYLRTLNKNRVKQSKKFVEKEMKIIRVI